MKYFRFKAGDASSYGEWEIMSLTEPCTLEDATDLYLEMNQWLVQCDAVRLINEEITEELYNTMQCFEIFSTASNRIQNKNMNLYPTKEWAVIYSNPKKQVRIGYPNMHNVYKFNDNGDLIFLYHYNAATLGVLK